MGRWKVNLRQAVGQCRRAKKLASSESANKRKTADREKGRACEKTVSRVKMSNVKTSEVVVWEGFTHARHVSQTLHPRSQMIDVSVKVNCHN